MSETDPFSHENRMRAGASVAGLFEAMEDEILQQHMVNARDALELAATSLEQKGLEPREIWLSLIGIVIGPILP